jgi:hypothetical protein
MMKEPPTLRPAAQAWVRSPDITNWLLSPLSVLEPDPASEMASPRWPARHCQTGDGLGSWPAARRSDLHAGGQGGQFTAARPGMMTPRQAL